jgi:tetratricopeptide (TPR) repeat protein
MSKSIKLAPGVRMTFSKSGVSYSAGVKGYRVTKRADGRVQGTASIPGTGLSHTTVSRSVRGLSNPQSARRSPPPPPPAARSVKPGMLAPKGEKDLYRAVQAKDPSAMEQTAREHEECRLAAATMAGVLKLAAGDHARARQLLAWVFATGADPGADPFIKKYVTARFTLEVVSGATAELGLDRSSVGLALAELHQDAGDISAAIDVVEQLEPTTFAALSLAELYSQAGRHKDVLGLTEGMSNQDDATALLCVFRGISFREGGFFEASRESFKEALKSKKRVSVVRHRALLERARTYEAEGKRSMARKDLERIMAEDSDYEGLEAALASLAE